MVIAKQKAGERIGQIVAFVFIRSIR